MDVQGRIKHRLYMRAWRAKRGVPPKRRKRTAWLRSVHIEALKLACVRSSLADPVINFGGLYGDEHLLAVVHSLTSRWDPRLAMSR